MWPRIDGLRTLDLGTPGDLWERLNALVLSGKKQASAGLLEADYRADREQPEAVGERLVLIGSDGERIGEVCVRSVEIVPFRSVSI
ncbi:ASCH domain-containing protein [Streptomyces clavifer]|uniref:ASCH domain-containing protein n=1 Tax=Streptomyces clavifer TaxID=68188 RepID=UPI0036A90B29